MKAATELPRLHSLLVSQRGELILERYFNGRRAATLANVKSVSKSVIAALVGIAADRRLIGLKDPIGRHFADALQSPADSAKRAITLEDLLTMRSGLESTSNRNYGAWVQSRNWVRHALAKPLVAEPGSEMIYSTGNSHLLSAILTKATGKSTWQFAQEALAKPLGFNLAQWPRDPQGIYFGGNDMLMTPRQMLTFGEMYLHGGRVGATQIVPAAVRCGVICASRALSHQRSRCTVTVGGSARWPAVRRTTRGVSADSTSCSCQASTSSLSRPLPRQ